MILNVTALNQESKRDIFERLENYEQTDNDLVVRISVLVKDPETFRKCVEWKSKQIQNTWDDYFSMESISDWNRQEQ